MLAGAIDKKLIRQGATGHGLMTDLLQDIELMQSAAGHVWTLTCSGLEKPDHDQTIVSMLHLAEGIQYRLEDGYVWLMKNAGQTVELI